MRAVTGNARRWPGAAGRAREPGAGRGVAGPGGPGAVAGDGFITRPETAPGLEAALIPGAGSPGAACWPTPSAWPPSDRSSPSRTIPARWSDTEG